MRNQLRLKVVHAATDASYDKDGRLVSTVVSTVGVGEEINDPFCCPIAQRAVVASVGRRAYSLQPDQLRGDAFEVAIIDNEVVCVAAPTFDLMDMELVFKTTTLVMSTVAGPVPVAFDTRMAADWHEPLNYRDYLRSPQRAQWRTAMEVKMDSYRALNMYALESEAEVRAAGHEIMDTLWAFKIKFDKDGVFDKFNPRWCVVGTNMSRDIYESFSDVVRWTSVLILAAIRACYPVHDFQFDVSDAFQSTRTDSDPLDTPKPLYYRQAPGFEVTGANGEKLVCRALTAHQGRIDSARLFSTKFGRDCAKLAGMRRYLWDPQLWGFHRGPLATTSDDLEKVLASVAEQPGTADAPNGWAVFGRHVDDGVGISSSAKVTEFLMNALRTAWNIKLSRWQKVIGYAFDCNDNDRTVTISCLPVIATAVKTHTKDQTTFKPRHPYSMGITSVGFGERPPLGSPERAEFDAMQAKTKSLLGLDIWVSRAHTNMVFATNYLCGYMSNPSSEVYKHAVHNLLHEHHYPAPLMFGGGGAYHSLLSTESPVPPYTLTDYDWGLQFWVDANVATPSEEPAGAIADGAPQTEATVVECKSFTGAVTLLAGGVIEAVCQRQHLKNPDSHIAEITAGGTIVNQAYVHRGVLQELRLPQEFPSPVHDDSRSTIFVARDAGSIKKSSWTYRRSSVVRQGVDELLVRFVKVADADNCADMFTKPVDHAKFCHLLSQTHQHAAQAKRREPVVEG
jgi:hypothetical protein